MSDQDIKPYALYYKHKSPSFNSKPNFVSNASNFQNPKNNVNHDKGLLVLQLDDGTVGDYTQSLDIALKKGREHSNWFPNNQVVIVPAINTGYLNHDSTEEYPYNVRMTDEQVKEIDKHGSEIISHGHLHATLGQIYVTKSVNSGEKRIYHHLSFNTIEPGYKYDIYEDDKSETVTIDKRVEVENGDNYVETTEPLENSYTDQAKMLISEESAKKEIQDTIDYLNNLGIDCKHHAYAWNAHTDDTRSYISDLVVSARTGGSADYDVANETDSLLKLPSLSDTALYNGEINKDIIDEQLTKAKEKDGVWIIHGHSHDREMTRESWKYLIDKAFEMGVKIATMTEAVEHLKSKQQE